MRRIALRQPLRKSGPRRRSFGLGCALVLVSATLVWLPGAAGAEAVAAGKPEVVVGSAAASGSTPAAPTGGGPTATLEQCFPSLTQAERSATFLGEMTSTPGTGRMSMRIELQERLSGQTVFRNVAASGLGVWRAAAPGVKVYRYIKQVTNLSAPAVYRAAIRFRWLNAKGKLIKAVERHTASCTQPPGLKPLPGTTPSYG